jgi:hypothetical protein
MRDNSSAEAAQRTGTIQVVAIPLPGAWAEQFCLAREIGSTTRSEQPRFAWYCGVRGFRIVAKAQAEALGIVRFRCHAQAVERARELAQELLDEVA